MTQTTLRPNEFIVRVEEYDEQFVFHIRNPHRELGNENLYDIPALANLAGFMKAASQLRKCKPKPSTTDESNPEHNPG